MEKQLSDIVVVTALEDIILLIKEIDIETPNAKCCQLDMSTNKYIFFDDINIPLKFIPFEETSKESWESYREEIYKRVKDSIIVEILQGFEGEVDELEKAEKIKGGLADNKTLKDVATHHKVELKSLRKEFITGLEVEMEHTDDEEVAEEIAKDHLWEDPNYYTKLKKVEK